jgi:CheY-like chemotaxis protein
MPTGAAGWYNRPMVIVAVDDLLFSSKIRAAAKQTGVELTFARTPAEVLDRARELKPRLVVFDLNSAKVDPIGTIAAMKKDPALAAIPTVGFVSHVDAATIAAARQAGADHVLARSAFASQLAEILVAGGSGQS